MSLAQIILRKLPASKNNLPCINSLSKTLVCQRSTKDGPPSSSSSSSESDEEHARKPSNIDAVTRLNSLLQQMVSDEASRGKEALKLAQPTNKRAKGREQKESVTTESPENQVINAVKGVADSLGGNTKQTESELLMKLLNPVDSHSGSSSSLSDILKGMKIERDVQPVQSKAEQVRNVLQKFSARTGSHTKTFDQRRPKRQNVPMIDQG